MHLPQDLCGAQLSKQDLREELKLVKRVNDIKPNMKLNPELITNFHKVRFGNSDLRQWLREIDTDVF